MLDIQHHFIFTHITEYKFYRVRCLLYLLRGLEQVIVTLEDVSHRRLLSGEHLVTEPALLGVAQAPQQIFLHLDAGYDGF